MDAERPNGFSRGATEGGRFFYKKYTWPPAAALRRRKLHRSAVIQKIFCKEEVLCRSYLEKPFMNPRYYKIYDDSYPYFITTGVMFSLPIFSNTKTARIIIENLKFLNEKRDVRIYAYVIMENHIHAIFEGDDLQDKIGRVKSYSA